MADAVLHVTAQLGKGLRETVWHKERVIAESTATAGCKVNVSFTRAIEQLGSKFAFVRQTNG